MRLSNPQDKDKEQELEEVKQTHNQHRMKQETMDTTQSREKEEDERMTSELGEIFGEPDHTRIKKEEWRESPDTTIKDIDQNKKKDTDMDKMTIMEERLARVKADLE